MIERNLEYKGTFSSNGILYNETCSLLPILMGNNVLKELNKEVMENQLLLINSEATRGRAIREIKKRSQYVDKDYWIRFSESDEGERRLLFFYLCLKTYKIIFDLHFEVTVKRFFTGLGVPDAFALNMAIDQIAANNEVVDSWSDTTLLKTFSNYKSLLKTSGLSDGKNLTIPKVESSFWESFHKNGEKWFPEACFQR